MKTKKVLIAGVSIAAAVIAYHYFQKNKKSKSAVAQNKADEDEKDQKAAEELVSFSGGRKAGRNMRPAKNESTGLRFTSRHK